MRKRILQTLILAIFLVLATGRVSAEGIVGCPGRQNKDMGVEYWLEPSTNSTGCIEIVIGPKCYPNSPHFLEIRNENCSQNLIYKSFNGTELELEPGSALYGDKIPQEIGKEWSTEIYFEDNPENKIKIKAHNYPVELYEGLTSKRANFCENKVGKVGTKEYWDCLDNHRLSDFKNTSLSPITEPTSNPPYWIIGPIIAIIVAPILWFLLNEK